MSDGGKTAFVRCSIVGVAVIRAMRSTTHARPDSTAPAPRRTGTNTLLRVESNHANGFSGSGVLACSCCSTRSSTGPCRPPPCQLAVRAWRAAEQRCAEKSDLGREEDHPGDPSPGSTPSAAGTRRRRRPDASSVTKGHQARDSDALGDHAAAHPPQGISLTAPVAPVDRHDPHARRGTSSTASGHPDDGGHAELAGEDGEVRQHAAGLGHQAAQAGQHEWRRPGSSVRTTSTAPACGATSIPIRTGGTASAARALATLVLSGADGNNDAVVCQAERCRQGRRGLDRFAGFLECDRPSGSRTQRPSSSRRRLTTDSGDPTTPRSTSR